MLFYYNFTFCGLPVVFNSCPHSLSGRGHVKCHCSLSLGKWTLFLQHRFLLFSIGSTPWHSPYALRGCQCRWWGGSYGFLKAQEIEHPGIFTYLMYFTLEMSWKWENSVVSQWEAFWSPPPCCAHTILPLFSSSQSGDLLSDGALSTVLCYTDHLFQLQPLKSWDLSRCWQQFALALGISHRNVIPADSGKVPSRLQQFYSRKRMAHNHIYLLAYYCPVLSHWIQKGQFSSRKEVGHTIEASAWQEIELFQLVLAAFRLWGSCQCDVLAWHEAVHPLRLTLSKPPDKTETARQMWFL